MNPLKHLPKRWEELATPQIWEVILAYAEQNRYPFREPSRLEMNYPLIYFEACYTSTHSLISFFEDWQQ